MYEFLKAVLETAGPMAVLVAFLMWWTYKREQKVTKSLDETQAWIRDTLINMNNSTAAALQESTKAIESIRVVIERCNRD